MDINTNALGLVEGNLHVESGDLHPDSLDFHGLLQGVRVLLPLEVLQHLVDVFGLLGIVVDDSDLFENLAERKPFHVLSTLHPFE